MSEWTETCLGEIADVLVGFAFKSTQFTCDPMDVRLLRGVNIGQGELNWGQKATLPAHLLHDDRYRLVEGDVVLAMDRPWIEAGLKRARVRPDDLPSLLVQRVARLRGTDRATTSFIHHLLATDSFSAYLRNVVTGATVPHISQSQIEAFKLRVPPMEVQERLGEVLDAIDDLIENNRRRVEVLEEMARAIYREWFVHFRYPGHEDVPLVDSPLGPIPDGWEQRTVSESTELVSRGIAPKYADDGVWTVINQKCIRDERVSLGKARRQARPVPGPKQVRRGDVLINSTGVGTLGRAALCLIDHPSLTVDSHVTIARPSEPAANPWFGLALVGKQAEFEQLGTGSTGQTELSRSDIGAMPLLVPPERIRAAFADAVWPLLDSANAFLDQVWSLASLRDLLLPKLVTGQIDVSRLDLDELTEAATA